MDPEFTGDKLLTLVLDLQAAVGKNCAGMTPLGVKVMKITESAMDLDQAERKEDHPQ